MSVLCKVWWFGSDGNEHRVEVVLSAVPTVGSFIDLEPVDDEQLEGVGEDERINLAHLQVVRVVHSATGEVLVEVERDAEETHQLELLAKDRTLDHLRDTSRQALDLLEAACTEVGAFFDFEGGTDDDGVKGRDLIGMRIVEGDGYKIPTALLEAVDAVYVYPDFESAKRGSGVRRCIKHRSGSLVTK